MHKSIICGLGIVFLAIGLNSCGKTNTRKITNDWKIVSLEEEQKSTSEQFPQASSWKSTMTETTVSNFHTYTYMDAEIPVTYSNTATGIVKENKLSIRKDGTWQWTQETSFDGNGGTQNDTYKKDLSGTWSFLTKNKGDDFKKNERVVFNILLQKSGTIQTVGQEVVTDHSEEITFLTSENTMTFTVKESTNKELQLEAEFASNYFNSFGPVINSNSGTLKMTLKED